MTEPKIRLAQVTALETRLDTIYTQANSAYGAANTASSTGGGGYDQANTARNTANAAYGQANTARSDANTTFATINTTFSTINTNYQAAYAQANLAYAAANNSNLKAGGAIVGDISITGNLFVNGAQTIVNTNSLTVNDPIFLLANNNTTNAVGLGFVAHYGPTQQHTGLIRAHQDEKWYLFDGYDEHILYANNVLDTGNTKLATLKANVEANTLTVVNGVSGNVNFDSGTLFVDSVGNKVGIGTTLPAVQLNLTGSDREALRLVTTGNVSSDGYILQRFNDVNGSAAYIGFGGNSNTFDINNYKSGSIRFATVDSERMRIDANGNIGIATTNPRTGYTFDVRGNIITNGLIGFLGTDGTSNWGLIRGNNSGSAIIGDAQTLHVTSGGRVGIGTTSPGTGFHVYDSSINATAKLQNANVSGYAELIFESATKVSSIFQSSGGYTNYGGANAFNIYAASGSKIAFHPGGASNKVIFDTNGNVGIGTTNPSSPLHVVTGSADSSGFNFETTGSSGKTFFAVHKLGFIRVRSSDTNGAAIHFFDNAGSKRAELSIGSDSKINWYSDALTSNWLTFDGGNGRIGIGTDAPGTKLNILIGNGGGNGTPAIRIGGTDNYASLELGIFGAYDGMITSYGNDIRYYSGHWRTIGSTSSEDHSHYWFTSRAGSADWSNIKMRLDHNGDLVVGQGWTYGNLQLSGTLSGYGAREYPTLKTSGQCIYFDASGTYTGYICYNGGFTDVSDARLKTNVTPLSNALNTVINLQGVRYAWKDGRDDFQEHVGFIAQQVQEVLPEAVSDPHPHDAEVAMLGIKSPAIVAVLVEAVKEQQAIIESLKSRIEALESQ